MDDYIKKLAKAKRNYKPIIYNVEKNYNMFIFIMLLLRLIY